jgi:hypothetical protein
LEGKAPAEEKPFRGSEENGKPLQIGLAVEGIIDGIGWLGGWFGQTAAHSSD